jgi:hypothetical protein
MPIPVTVNQRGDWDFIVIEKKVLVPMDDTGETVSPAGAGVFTYEGMADVVPNHKAILREDTGRVFYIGSDKYQPVPHRTVLGPVITALTPIARRITVRSINHGAKVFADFLNHTPIIIGAEAYLGGIRIVNSLDGTLTLVIEGFLLRERDDSCLMLSETLSSFERRHVFGQFTSSDFAEVARTTLATVVSRLTNLQAVASVRITEVAFRQLIGRIDMPQKYKKLAYDIWETPDIAQIDQSTTGTIGAVLNLLAYLGTHEMTRTLNDEAMYRWQRNVDAVLSRQLRTVLGDEATMAQPDHSIITSSERVVTTPHGIAPNMELKQEV